MSVSKFTKSSLNELLIGDRRCIHTKTNEIILLDPHGYLYVSPNKYLVD